LKTALYLGGIVLTSLPMVEYLRSQPAFVEKDLWTKKAVLAELVEMIIPETDTVGAKAMSVENYVIMVVLNCSNTRQQRRFLSGIEDLEAYTLRNYGVDFLRCAAPEREKVLLYFAQKGWTSNTLFNKVEQKLFGQPFFLRLRALTVEGYCQSKLGATQGLAYDLIPGSFEPCTSLNPSQRSWATK
jgi:hypothetical protein